MTTTPTLNRLASETSPYLLQHADNPVDWYPWGAAALQRARDEDKPILLSIGYSACHWCHVMAHESFEDPSTAAVMNQHFVNIKVDREERPDIDKIYQLAQQILTRHAGGWPLTMFLSPHDHQPFFGGTYFPPTAQRGMPSFIDLLTRVASYYQEHGDDIREQTQALQRVFTELQPEPSPDTELHAAPLLTARESLQADFDGQFGGFNSAPKFPHARIIEFLLRRWHASSTQEQPDLHALYMSALTLTRMAEGGLFDQLGGGFFRYSVDQYWMIPHFEKMLYDNAELLRVYAQAALATGDPLFKRVAQATAAWLLRDMRAADGAFFSTWDADSEGHEGKYYVWDAAQLQRLLPANEYDVFAKRFGLDQAPNFVEPHSEPKWHLHSYRSLSDIAAELQIDETEVEHRLQHARSRLLALREQRVPPMRDEKLLTSWNGLAIAALATAARILNDTQLADAACAAVDQLRTHAWRDGRLWAVQAGGTSKFAAYLDDYAFLLDAMLEVLQTRWRNDDLTFAIELAETLLRDFLDAERGGFYFTASDHEALIHRSKSFADEATPSGNAVAALALNRLGYLLGEPRYIQAAEGIVHANWQALLHHPAAHATLLNALDEQLSPPQLVIIRGAGAELQEWQQGLAQLYSPRRLVFAIPNSEMLPDALAIKAAAAHTVAYVCNGMVCDAPVNSLAALIALTR